MAYRNPIIPGFAPDPSIVRIKDTFYLVNSSFHLFPGLPVFASKDLIAWRHIGNATHRQTQLQLNLSQSGTKLNETSPDGLGEKAPATRGLYAPTIRYHHGITYIVCTNVIYDASQDMGDWVSGLSFQNFIISTPDIGVGQWSDPVFFDFIGIDPDLFFDDDGRTYITGSSWTPSPSCSIACFEINIQTGEKLTAERVLWTGHTGLIPEGPHIYRRSGYYYLLVAEGGTHEGHCITIARSQNIYGPYEPCDRNPILQPTVELGPHTYYQYSGHGDLVQDLHGDWWMVCLAVRRDRAGRMMLGRETCLAPVEWSEDRILPKIQQPLPRKLWRRLENGDENNSSFSSATLEAVPYPLSPRLDLVWIRDPDFKRYRISSDARMISLLPSAVDIGECTGLPTSFVGRRQRRYEGSATVVLAPVAPQSAEFVETAAVTTPPNVGLALYKDEHRFARIMYSPTATDQNAGTTAGVVTFEALNRAKVPPIWREKTLEVALTRVAKLQFRMVYTEQLVHFLFRVDGGRGVGDTAGQGWQSFGLIDTLEMSGKDFTGPVIGVFATGSVGNGNRNGTEGWWTFEDVDI